MYAEARLAGPNAVNGSKNDLSDLRLGRQKTAIVVRENGLKTRKIIIIVEN